MVPATMPPACSTLMAGVPTLGPLHRMTIHEPFNHTMPSFLSWSGPLYCGQCHAWLSDGHGFLPRRKPHFLVTASSVSSPGRAGICYVATLIASKTFMGNTIAIIGR